jgi:ADP-ribosylglycohydrolase
VGGTTAQALGAIRPAHVLHGTAAAAALSAANTTSQANGALMRVSPLGIWGADRDASAVATAARAEARLTHPHPVCQDASALFVVAIAEAVAHGLAPQALYGFARQWGRAAQLDDSVMAAVEAARHAAPADYQTQQGWVLIALHNAFYQLLHAATLEDAVVATVRAGGDTDTNAAICGALLGAVRGRDEVPAQWRRMVLSCRPLQGHPGVTQPRPRMYWPTDALVLAERLLLADSERPE